MRTIMATVCGLALALAAVPALAQTPPPRVNGTLQEPVAPPLQVAPTPSPPDIGTIAGVPVRLWAPVEEPYNTLANRNGAASPLLANSPGWWPSTFD